MNIYLTILLLIFSSLTLNLRAKSLSDSLRTEKKQGKTFIIHKIDSGESLASIAKRYKVEISVLMAANPKVKNARMRNHLLTIPIQSANNQSTIKTYRVKQGETVYSLTKKFLMTKERIIELNQLKNPDDIKAGSVIKVEFAPINTSTQKYPSWVYHTHNEIPVYHSVRDKETLFSIASSYSTKYDSIKSWNKLKTNKIITKQKLVVGYAKSNEQYEKWMSVQPKNMDNLKSYSVDSLKTAIHKDSVIIAKDSLSVTSREIDSLTVKKDSLANIVAIDTTNFNKVAKEPKIDSLTKLQNVLQDTVNQNKTVKDSTQIQQATVNTIDNLKDEFIRQEGTAMMVLGGKDDPQKPLALYRTASIGSFIKVINPLNGKSISVRVVGKITEEKDANILIKLSKYACDQIDAKEEQFKVLIEYQQQ